MTQQGKAMNPIDNAKQSMSAKGNKETVCIDNDRFCFKIEHEPNDNSELFKLLYSINDKLIYVTVINYASNNDLFSVSKYTAESNLTSDSAFAIAIGTKAALDGVNTVSYNLIDYGKYTINGIELLMRPFFTGIYANYCNTNFLLSTTTPCGLINTI
jgi:hypothetical protein